MNTTLKRNDIDYAKAAGPYADLVRELVESGEFEHPAEVILEALALLEQRELARKATEAKLREAVQEGLAQANRGELIPAEDVFARLEQRYKAKAGASTGTGQ